MWGSLGVLAVAVVMILISAQQMFISDQDLGVLMWIMLPAALPAALTAYVLSTPIARDRSGSPVRRGSQSPTAISAPGPVRYAPTSWVTRRERST